MTTQTGSNGSQASSSDDQIGPRFGALIGGFGGGVCAIASLLFLRLALDSVGEFAANHYMTAALSALAAIGFAIISGTAAIIGEIRRRK